MKCFLFSVVCLSIGLCVAPFFNSKVVAQAKNETIYTLAERQPEFPGGKVALSQYLAENIRIPGALTRKNREPGPVAARFIIDKFGYVRDVRIVARPQDKKNQKGMEDYMINIVTAVEKMPRWNPGEVGGKPVTVFYTLPIEVSIQ